MVRFELVVYMNEDGTQKYIWAQRGSMTTSNLIGFLEEVKFDILLAKEQQQ